MDSLKRCVMRQMEKGNRGIGELEKEREEEKRRKESGIGGVRENRREEETEEEQEGNEWGEKVWGKARRRRGKK